MELISTPTYCTFFQAHWHSTRTGRLDDQDQGHGLRDNLSFLPSGHSLSSSETFRKSCLPNLPPTTPWPFGPLYHCQTSKIPTGQKYLSKIFKIGAKRAIWSFSIHSPPAQEKISSIWLSKDIITGKDSATHSGKLGPMFLCPYSNISSQHIKLSWWCFWPLFLIPQILRAIYFSPISSSLMFLKAVPKPLFHLFSRPSHPAFPDIPHISSFPHA